ncbi:MAG: ATP-binding cassette domain-containing protein, partial [Nocardioidaceae bacterium]
MPEQTAAHHLGTGKGLPIQLVEVTKTYPGMETSAVDSISMEIAAGEIVVLVGPSGCGKTTTLRLLAGLEAASSGEITFGDRNVTNARPRDRNVAMVFQD